MKVRLIFIFLIDKIMILGGHNLKIFMKIIKKNPNRIRIAELY